MMKKISHYLVALTMSLGLSFTVIGASYAGDEAADQLVKRLSSEIIEAAKTDKDIQTGNRKKIDDLVETKVLPYINFDRMTSLAVGKNWREASAEQRKQLIAEFRTLLVHTYSGAITQIKDQRVEYKPFRASPEDTEVEVKSLVIQTRGEPLQLSYRLEKAGTSWKIYDINVLGAWLVETYKGSFAAEVSKTGLDGLIKTLVEKNKKLSATSDAKKS
jgi:phospholipid transport system substrate-binding protein